MNVLEFWGRIIGGFFAGAVSAALFGEGHLVPGIAALITAFFIVLTPFSMLRGHQRPRSLSSLKQDFDIYMLLAWNRGILGLLLGIGGTGMLDMTKSNDHRNTWASLVILVLGWLLVSPLGDRVFTYSRKDSVVYGKWRWNPKSSALYLTRFSGLVATVCGAGMLAANNVKLAEAIFVLVGGVALIFINQIKHYITGAAQAADKTVSPVTFKAPVAVKKIQTEQTVAAVTTVSLPADAVVKKEPNLAEQYKALQLLPVAEKGTAYGTFLNRLFDTEGLLTSSAFTVKETIINGSFELEGQIYILAAKWGIEKSDEDALLIFNAKVESRSTWARGIFISEAGFTKDGLALFAQGKRTSIIGMDGKDLQLVVDGKLSLKDAIKRKARRAVETNNFFVPLHELI